MSVCVSVGKWLLIPPSNPKLGEHRVLAEEHDQTSNIHQIIYNNIHITFFFIRFTLSQWISAIQLNNTRQFRYVSLLRFFLQWGLRLGIFNAFTFLTNCSTVDCTKAALLDKTQTLSKEVISPSAAQKLSFSCMWGCSILKIHQTQTNLQKPFSLHGKTNWFCLHQQQVQNHYSVQLSQTRPLFHCNVRGRLKILFHHLTDWPCVFHCPLQTHLETAAFLGTLFCFFFVTSEYGVKSLRTMTAFNPKHWQAQYDDKRLATLWVCKTLVQMIKWVVLREDSYSMN